MGSVEGEGWRMWKTGGMCVACLCDTSAESNVSNIAGSELGVSAAGSRRSSDSSSSLSCPLSPLPPVWPGHAPGESCNNTSQEVQYTLGRTSSHSLGQKISST